MKQSRTTPDKFESTSEVLIFVGYTDRSNTYRFFDQKHDKIVVSCNSKFLSIEHTDSPFETPDAYAAPDLITFQQNITEGYDGPSQTNDQSQLLTTNETIHHDSEQSSPDQSYDFEYSTPQTTPDKSIGSDSSPTASDHQSRTTDGNMVEPISTETDIQTSPKSSIDRSSTQRSPEETEETNETETIELQHKNQQKTNEDTKENHLRRSTRPRKQLNYRNLHAGCTNKESHNAQTALAMIGLNIAKSAEDDQLCLKECENRSDYESWKEAMDEEIASFAKNNVWTIVERPKSNVVTSRWVFKTKRNTDGSINRYRARLVARGLSKVRHRLP